MAGLDEQLTADLGSPRRGVAAAVKLAEGLSDLHLSTSKVRTFAPPRPQETQRLAAVGALNHPEPRFPHFPTHFHQHRRRWKDTHP